MEYEDMFPFEGIVESVKHKQAYTKDEIEKINQLANQNHLDVMPLLQTYGNTLC
jgi:hexosaminidase